MKMKKNINGLAWPAEQTTILELCSFLSETSIPQVQLRGRTFQQQELQHFQAV